MKNIDIFCLLLLLWHLQQKQRDIPNEKFSRFIYSTGKKNRCAIIYMFDDTKQSPQMKSKKTTDVSLMVIFFVELTIKKTEDIVL